MREKKWLRIDRATIIYCLIDPRDRLVRYVGKTCQRSATRLASHLNQARHYREYDRKYWVLHWIASLVAERLRPEFCELEVVPKGGDWSEAEQFWIETFRGWGFPLCNVRVGGEAGNFSKQSRETVEKRVSKLKGKPGRKLSAEQRAAAAIVLARARSKRVWTPEQKAELATRARSIAHSFPRRRGAANPGARAIVVGNRRYGSVADATREQGVTRRTVYNWLRDGAARYDDDPKNIGESFPPAPRELYASRPRRGHQVVVGDLTYPSKGSLARILGVSVSTVTYRLRRGLPVDALPKRVGLRALAE